MWCFEDHVRRRPEKGQQILSSHMFDSAVLHRKNFYWNLLNRVQIDGKVWITMWWSLYGFTVKTSEKTGLINIHLLRRFADKGKQTHCQKSRNCSTSHQLYSLILNTAAEIILESKTSILSQLIRTVHNSQIGAAFKKFLLKFVKFYWFMRILKIAKIQCRFFVIYGNNLDLFSSNTKAGLLLITLFLITKRLR